MSTNDRNSGFGRAIHIMVAVSATTTDPAVAARNVRRRRRWLDAQSRQ
jgi:hypothetical protein